jgi:hypothetical protein
MWICHCNEGKTNRLKPNGNENIWCHQNMNRKKCVYFDNDPNTSRSFPHSWLITGFVTRLTRRVPLVEQELLTLPEHQSSSPVFSVVRVTRSLVLCVCFVDHYLSFVLFLLIIVFSVLLRHTDSDYPFGIFKLFLFTLFVFVCILCCDFVVFFFILCVLCCQFLWIVNFWLPLRYSLTFICQFLWIVNFWLPLRYSLTFICQFLWIVNFWLPLRYSLTFICQFLWIVNFWLPLRYSLTFISIYFRTTPRPYMFEHKSHRNISGHHHNTCFNTTSPTSPSHTSILI